MPVKRRAETAPAPRCCGFSKPVPLSGLPAQCRRFGTGIFQIWIQMAKKGEKGRLKNLSDGLLPTTI
ncbi:hypothetical protein [Neisseria musculi]|uniref:Uncharacterized protein n=1 Tax=Neisseria musculi TaxID=1815583 RepID=A0A7H1MEG8_9NEIS|nr:hypothetical protein [Neisseria musculi]QNT60033.1 hypothetical protein H7A79_2037 [Neisseria musculi]